MRPLTHALDGLRVLDFSGFFAAAYGAKLLSDLGADVIKVETLGGDQMRPMPDLFEASNRGKRNLAVDLKSAEGRAVVARLVATSDVVIHNLRPGKAERLGIGYEQLVAIKPDLVYCYLPGFGSTGPKSHLKSFAPLVSGFTGLLYEGSGEGNPPIRRVMGNEDYYNGFLGAVAALLALEHRARTGEGQYLESPHLHSSLFVTTEQCLDADGRAVSPWQLDHEQLGFGPLYRLYQTSDGWLALACVGTAPPSNGSGKRSSSWRWPTRTTAVRPPSWRRCSRIASASSRPTTPSPCSTAMACRARSPSRTRTCPSSCGTSGRCRPSASLEHEEHYSVGYIREMGLVVRLSDTPGVVKGTAPRLGEHSVEILDELGYEPAEIEALVTRRLHRRPSGRVRDLSSNLEGSHDRHIARRRGQAPAGQRRGRHQRPERCRDEGARRLLPRPGAVGPGDGADLPAFSTRRRPVVRLPRAGRVRRPHNRRPPDRRGAR